MPAPGALPGEEAGRLTPGGAHLEDEEWHQVDGLGWFSCSVTVGGEDVGDERLVVMNAYTRRDDQDRRFMSDFAENRGFDPLAAMPAGLPGFVDHNDTVNLMVPCPALGKDADGRPRRMLVLAAFGEDARKHAPTAPYRMAIALTNAASDRLGCGAKPLTAPQPDAVLPDTGDADDTKAVSPDRTKGTGCSWLARAGLPDGRRWQVDVEANSAAPVERCDVSAPARAGHDQDRDGVWLGFGAWYGDWSTRLAADEYNGEPYPMTATARCAGEAATYALHTLDYPTPVTAALQRRLLRDFAEDQVRRRGCSDLEFAY